MGFPALMIAGIAVSSATAAASGIMAYSSAQQAASAQQNLAGFQAAAAEQNAQLSRELAERNAQTALRRAEAEAKIVTTERGRTMGMARVLYSGRGVRLQGTPLLVMADRAQRVRQEIDFIRAGGKEDATTARFAGEMAARNESLRAAGLLYSADLEARALRSSGFGALLGGLGTAAGGALSGFGQLSFFRGLSGGGAPIIPGFSPSQVFPGFRF